ncbi:MAG TPA: flagellar biosynthetic protein FliP, partial [Gammaproteobacteria bacterium]|nr:flagellar biosynthetic protein FliP [Gammaproteobacteria bacterium]
MKRAAGLAVLACLALSQGALAQEAPGLPALSLATAADGSQTWSLSIQVLALMTALTLLPALVL